MNRTGLANGLQVAGVRQSSAIFVTVLTLVCTSSLWGQAIVQKGPVLGTGRVTGAYAVLFDGDRPVVDGWACERGDRTSIVVRLYVDHPPDATPKGTLIATTQADMWNEPAVSGLCEDQLGRHRFRFFPSSSFLPKGRERKFYVEAVPAPGPIPKFSGSYTSLSMHPRVFTTSEELEELARRINKPDSYSAKRFKQQAAKVAGDLASPNDWSAVYTGCNASLIQYAFSYEPQDNHVDQTLHSLLGLGPGVKAPAGAAVFASRLALYAALVKAGAAPPAGAPDSTQAAAVAKKILLAWSERGFRDGQGHSLASSSQFCNTEGKWDDGLGAAIGLAIGRGVHYSVHAQDLLMYLGALNKPEIEQLNTMHAALFELLRNNLNDEFDRRHQFGCDMYGNNQRVGHLAALLAVARLLDDKRRFEAALFGQDSAIPVRLPWTLVFDAAIYGEGDTPHSCYPNTGPDRASSHPFFSTAEAAPGEMNDRFRNMGPGQGLGYTMGTLERVFDAAEILRNAGYDSYGYHGVHNQSIEIAIQYYACYAKGAGFYKIVTPENSRACPDAEQYYGNLVHEVDRELLIGAYRFPRNAAITSLEDGARTAAFSATFGLDSILFGKWRD